MYRYIVYMYLTEIKHTELDYRVFFLDNALFSIPEFKK